MSAQYLSGVPQWAELVWVGTLQRLCSLQPTLQQGGVGGEGVQGRGRGAEMGASY